MSLFLLGQLETILFQNSKCQCGKKCYSAKEIPKNVVKIRTSFLSELIIVSFLREKNSLSFFAKAQYSYGAAKSGLY